MLTASTALPQADRGDALLESMGDPLITSLGHSFQLVILPDQKASMALLLWLMQRNTQSGLGACVLQAPQASSPAHCMRTRRASPT
jgi:hypothetical protein